ncbi:TetR family transcriptional regulator [Agromyces sp. CFH 90414]|uniref:TetR family transcriptional regulator n=1 Tax=Agromyces agglutinans TaxID=2662258 RepID=A0A6I2F685_9MICO|nr:TetR family transcriptional regulator [Agromyces agglutinans]MRG60119.1 TetR family transcriptional regulator [Agromyces agglutinans]
MPRLADHDHRRRQITDAARRVVARGGLPAATFQSIAAEADLSVRLVQYYFGTKDDVLRATRQAVAADAALHIASAVSEAADADAADPREVIRAILLEVLPVDAARRDDSMVLNAFFFDEITGGASDAPSRDAAGAANYLETLVRDRIVLTGTDRRTAEIDARLIVAAASGLAQAMLADRELAPQAGELLDRLLDRMLTHR